MNNINTVCQIDNHSLLLVRGPDARKFLQGQVTCDIEQLSIQTTDNGDLLTTSLGAHCTHKGRIVFTFRALPLDEHTIALNLPADMMNIATTALKKYIVFSKAELIDASEEYKIIGVHSESATQQLTNVIPNLPSTIDTAINHEKGIIICLSSGRYELWLTQKQYTTIVKLFTDYPLSSGQYWDFANINDGIGEIQTATSEKFTPHAINLQSTSRGVSFQKGCYTGQEVVARMHYLGKLKKQMFLFELPRTLIDELPKIGHPLYSPGKSQSIGEIVLIAEHGSEVHLLASVTVEQANQNLIYVDQTCQKKLNLLPLSKASSA